MDKTDSDVVSVPPGVPKWITPDLISETLAVWAPKYEKRGVMLTTEDAIEILVNVGALADVLGVDQVDANTNNIAERVK